MRTYNDINSAEEIEAWRSKFRMIKILEALLIVRNDEYYEWKLYEW